MIPIRGSTVRCEHCDAQFPGPASLQTVNDFVVATRVGTVKECPECRALTRCGAGNMSYVLEDGTVGRATPDN